MKQSEMTTFVKVTAEVAGVIVIAEHDTQVPVPNLVLAKPGWPSPIGIYTRNTKGPLPKAKAETAMALRHSGMRIITLYPEAGLSDIVLLMESENHEPITIGAE